MEAGEISTCDHLWNTIY